MHKDLRLAERINAELVVHGKRAISPGQAAMALIFGVAVENNLLGDLNYLDSTTLRISGDYAQLAGSNPAKPTAIQLTFGHSKDIRPDLK